MSPTLGYIPSDRLAVNQDEQAIDSEIVEVPLLLPLWQVVALESAAEKRGMTTAQMLRKMIGELISNQPKN
jgi:hypothetical protein